MSTFMEAYQTLCEESDELNGQYFIVPTGSWKKRKEFWEDARKGELSTSTFTRGFINDKLKEMLEKAGVNFEDLFVEDPLYLNKYSHSLPFYRLNGKGCYKAIKQVAEVFPDEWYVKALKKFWSMLYADNIVPEEDKELASYNKSNDEAAYKRKFIETIIADSKPDSVIKKVAERSLDKSWHYEYQDSVFFSIGGTIVFEHKYKVDSYDEYADLDWHTASEYRKQRQFELNKDDYADPVELAHAVIEKENSGDYKDTGNGKWDTDSHTVNF